MEQSQTMKVEAAGKVLGIGRSLAYQLAARGELPGLILLGGRMVVSRARLDRYLEGPACECADKGKSLNGA